MPTDNKISLGNNPLDEINNFLNTNQSEKDKNLPDFHGGLVGYFGYDTIRYIEGKLANSSKPDLNYPDISLMISDEVIIYDNLKKTLFIIVNGSYENEADCLKRIEQIHQKILEPVERRKIPQKNNIKFTSSVKKEDYLKAIKKIKDYIVEGDVMQVVYGQELTTPFKGSAIELYKSLRKLLSLIHI